MNFIIFYQSFIFSPKTKLDSSICLIPQKTKTVNSRYICLFKRNTSYKLSYHDEGSSTFVKAEAQLLIIMSSVCAIFTLSPRRRTNTKKVWQEPLKSLNNHESCAPFITLEGTYGSPQGKLAFTTISDKELVNVNI